MATAISSLVARKDTVWSISVLNTICALRTAKMIEALASIFMVTESS